MRIDARRLGWAAALVTLTSGGCDTTTGPDAVEGRLWMLVSLQRAGAAPVAITDPSRFTLELGGSALAARADCNRCHSGYTTAGEKLIIGPLACTRVFCAQTAPLDTEYASLLGGTHTYAVRQGLLTLRSSQGTLRFRR